MSDKKGFVEQGLEWVWDTLGLIAFVGLAGAFVWAFYASGSWKVPAGGAVIGAGVGLYRAVSGGPPYRFRRSELDIIMRSALNGALIGIVLVFVFYSCGEPGRYQDLPHGSPPG